MLPLVAVTVMVRTLLSAPTPTVALSVPSVPVFVPAGVATPPLSTLMLTDTFASALRLASMAVAVATTVSVPLLAIVGALKTSTRSVAAAVPSPPPVPPSPPGTGPP